MKHEAYESRKPFAGEKKPSMLRRCVDHDYTGRMMYMVTMVTEGRRPLFGRVTGRSEAAEDAPDAPRMELTALGQRVSDEWWGIPRYYPQIEIVALQMMPDHLHGILFVREQMEKDLSRVIRGFKTGCNRAYRELVIGPPVLSVATQSPVLSVATESPVPSVATQSPVLSVATQSPVPSVATQSPVPSVATQSPVLSVATESQLTKPSKDDRTHGLLFARGFNDKLLLRQGQLQRWLDYLRDNPRRLLMRREHPDLFRVQRGLTVGAQQFSAIGNRFLLQRPVKLQVQCSRRLTEEEVAAKTAWWLAQARSGAVLVSPCISKGEKAVMRAAFDEGLPLIILQENGFTELAKPGGKRMEACASGQILILAPWDHHNERLAIRRDQCLALNAFAKMICEG